MTIQTRRWTRPPWAFRLAKWLNRRRIRGGYRLLDTAASWGWLDGLVRYQLSPRIAFLVPIKRPENRWSLEDVLGYETCLVTTLVERLSAWPGPVRLVDCGADIGILTARLASKLDSLAEVDAFEPNPEAFAVLRDNVALLDRPARAYNTAVSDFSGRGVLRSTERDRSAHARFLVPAEADAGDFDVTTIDRLELPRTATLAIKIDVEGGELAVLRGAARTLAETPRWVVAYEAHREVCARTGLDPCEILRSLATSRPIGHRVAERPDVKIDPERPFFQQVGDLCISNVVCWSD